MFGRILLCLPTLLEVRGHGRGSSFQLLFLARSTGVRLGFVVGLLPLSLILAPLGVG